MTSLILPLVVLLVLGFLLAATNPSISAHLTELYSDWPDIDAFDTVLGTDYFGYIGAWFGELGAKFTAFMSLIGAVTIFPEISLYGQTMDASGSIIMGLVNIAFLSWFGFAVWERLPMMGGP
jgi:hypothetical protein